MTGDVTGMVDGIDDLILNVIFGDCEWVFGAGDLAKAKGFLLTDGLPMGDLSSGGLSILEADWYEWIF